MDDTTVHDQGMVELRTKKREMRVDAGNHDEKAVVW